MFDELPQQEYFCLRCLKIHYDTEGIYHLHLILHRSDEGIRDHVHEWRMNEQREQCILCRHYKPERITIKT